MVKLSAAQFEQPAAVVVHQQEVGLYRAICSSSSSFGLSEDPIVLLAYSALLGVFAEEVEQTCFIVSAKIEASPGTVLYREVSGGPFDRPVELT